MNKGYLRNFFILIVLLLSGLLGFLLSWYRNSPDDNTVVARVIDTYHYPAIFVQQLKNDPRAGEKIFYEFCAACHAAQPTIDVLAPRINQRAVWQGLSRLSKARLLQNTLQGIGIMPARGGCFECSDQQLEQAIDYILSKAAATQ